ncbi:MAG: hypothetical protein PHC97_03840 [Patescibacteria group bacterium]|nr:hypothetical protein [Patescibacteria group bacterium]
MKKIFFLLLVFLFIAFIACGGPQTMDGQDVSEAKATAQCNGNGTCDAGETVASCPADCQVSQTCDNNGVCGSGETAENCPADCRINPPTDHVTGTLDFAGVAITLDFTAQMITFQNQNPYMVKLAGFFNGLILEPGQTRSEGAGLTIDQQVYIQAWLGDAAIAYPSLHGGDPDISGSFFLKASSMSVNLIYGQGYVALVQAGNTVTCQFSGRYGEINPETGKSDPTLQRNNTMYCLNSGSGAVKVELFHLKLVGSEKYNTDANLVSFNAISSQTGQIKTVDWDYIINDVVAIRVINLTNGNTTVSGYYINVTLNQAYKLPDSTEINILE